jgi:hypothetical protein
MEHIVSAQDCCHAGHTFTTRIGNFDRAALFGNGKQRDHPFVWKIAVTNVVAGLGKNHPGAKRDKLKIWA